MRMWSTVAAALVLGVASAAGAQSQTQAPLQADKTVSYQADSPIALDIQVGPVKVSGIKVTVGTAAGMGGSLKAKVSGFNQETQAVLHVGIDAENAMAEGWKVSYLVEFLDAKGTVADRLNGKASYKNGAKTTTFDHVTLKAVLPLIDKIRIKCQASKD